ncbi:MAG: hypothetical protein H7325_04120 [Pedobacter sp.]|nr:hypothetical protein [Pedobacter sp.]
MHSLRLYITLLVLTSLLNLSGYSQNVVFEREDMRFWIEAPSNWRLDTLPIAPKVIFGLYSPRESESDQFSENINLVSDSLSNGIVSLDEYILFSEKQIRSNAINLKEFSVKSLSSDDWGEYGNVTFKMTYGSFQLVTMQWYFCVNRKVLVLTFTAQDSASSEIIDLGKKIIQSFLFMENKRKVG